MQYRNGIIGLIIKISKKQFKVILIITIITVLISALSTKILINPKYEASLKVFVGKENKYMESESKEEVDMYYELMETYAETIKTTDLIKESIKNANLEIKPEEILDNLKVEILSKSRILKISVIYKEYNTAIKILEAISDEFIKKSKRLVINGDIKIIESVQVKCNPINQNYKKNILINLIIGLMIGIITLVFLENKKVTYNNIKSLEKKLEVPVIGIVDSLENRIEEVYIRVNYKKIVENLKDKFFDSINKVMVITSPESKEGKSIVSKNLGMILSQSGKKVILIDCDFKKASLHRKFNITNDSGLSDILIEKKQLEEVVNKYNDGLTILTTGKEVSEPYDMLCSSTMESFIQYLKTLFDYIIIDAPSVYEDTIDIKVISEKSDGILMIIKEGKSRKKSIIESIDIIKRSNSYIVGIMLVR